MKNITKILVLITIFGISFNAKAQSSEYHLLVMSDLHLGENKTMELAPSQRNPDNDLDEATFQLFLSNMQQLITTKQLSPQSGLVLGDLVDHVSGNINTGTTAARINRLFSSFSQLSQWSTQLNVPLSYVFGNNDSLLGDYNAFYMRDNALHSPYEVAVSTGWRGGFTTGNNDCVNRTGMPCMINEDKTNGQYVEYLAPKLALIVIDSVPFNSHQTCDDICHGELSWLSQQLREAHNRRDSVLLALHIPPGMDMNSNRIFWQQDTLNQFLQAIQPDINNIIAVLVSHTHMEQLQMIRVDQTHVIPVIYTAGLSTAHGNVPAFKYLTLLQDQDKWILRNYQTYHFTNNNFNFYYDFQTDYCANANMPSIADCLETYVNGNQLQNLLDKINSHYTDGNPNFTAHLNDVNPNDLVVNKL